MKNTARIPVFLSLLLLCVALRAQSAPAPSAPPIATTLPGSTAPQTVEGAMATRPADPEAPTHLGVRYADFVQVNEAMMETALNDPAIVEFSKKVEAMIAQRDEMIAAAASKKYPAIAGKIQTIKQNAAELKRKGEEQTEKMRGLRVGQPAQPVAPKN